MSQLIETAWRYKTSKMLGACVWLIQKHGIEHPPTLPTLARYVYGISSKQQPTKRQIAGAALVARRLIAQKKLARRKETESEKMHRLEKGADKRSSARHLYFPVFKNITENELTAWKVTA